ncbi:hypothetical protein [Streptomonospora salina]|uniref:Uncharacterized protein n=1 Tax=Streptomonospora salina TaxID=104205 RepID=A0A841EDI0_9ACTN|nr:hypothetical protein [Streptomonospora salina]MBB5999008.1 hypothetical protein [Streptomonospora salina]
MRLMDQLRSRVTMVVLAAVVTVALVSTGAVGLFRALNRPDPGPAPAAGQTGPPGSVSSPAAAPPLDRLGDAPDGTSYSDFGQQCPDVECVRVVGVSVEDGSAEQGSDEATEQAIETVFNHLLDEGWGRVLPDNEADPDDVPLGESYLTDGQVLITATPVDAPEASAGLMLMNAQEPGS